jgi:transposase
MAPGQVGQRRGHPVRQRLSRQRHGRRGRKQDPAWAHRTLLLCAGDRLSPTQLARLRRVLATVDPTNEIGAAWGCKELLRQLLDSPPEREEIRRRLWRFYHACATADMPETTRLATTVETWWPAILVALTTAATNARTEGFNRTIKQVKRVACGFRNMTTSNAASCPTSRSHDRVSRRLERGHPA